MGAYNTLGNGRKSMRAWFEWWPAVAITWLWGTLSSRRRVSGCRVQILRIPHEDWFREDFEALLELLRAGKIHPVVAEGLRFSDARRALLRGERPDSNRRPPGPQPEPSRSPTGPGHGRNPGRSCWPLGVYRGLRRGTTPAIAGERRVALSATSRTLVCQSRRAPPPLTAPARLVDILGRVASSSALGRMAAPPGSGKSWDGRGDRN
jgi:hypothetical protein